MRFLGVFFMSCVNLWRNLLSRTYFYGNQEKRGACLEGTRAGFIFDPFKLCGDAKQPLNKPHAESQTFLRD